jgi:hypothetical protein
MNTIARSAAPGKTLLAIAALTAMPVGCSATMDTDDAEHLGGSRQAIGQPIGTPQGPLLKSGVGRPIPIPFSEKCLDVNGGSTASGTSIIQWNCVAGALNQSFFLTDTGDGFTIRPVHSSKCLDVSDASLANGAPVIQWDCHGGPNQRFVPVWQSDGTYLLRAKHSNKCLDVKDVSKDGGATLIQWDCHGGPNQRFGAGDEMHAALARRYAPKVWLHSAEDSFPSSVDFFLPNTHEEVHDGVTFKVACDPCTINPNFLSGQNPSQTTVPVYAEIVHRTSNDQPQNVTDVIYWMFYPYNEGKSVCYGIDVGYGGCLGVQRNMGNHVGDWEHLTIRFVGGAPTQVYLSQHNGGDVYAYGDPDLKLDNGRPTVFAANGSHGLYHEEGSYYYGPITDLEDETNHGTMWDTGASVLVFTKEENHAFLPWLDYLGRWGNPKTGYCDSAFDECERNDGPESILTRQVTEPSYWNLE